MSHVPELIDHARAACEKAAVNGEAAYAVRLAVEEIVLNLVNYGYAGLPPGPIALAVETDGARVVVTIADHARPFDPVDAPVPDLEAAWDERKIGGLGWHLVKELMDEVRYETGGEGNRLTLVKRLA
jgi:anti-sigma regulatory factor (Ser/Thr protein kinase)